MLKSPALFWDNKHYFLGEVGMRGLTSAAVLAVVLAAGTTTAAYAQLAVSANDAKVKLVNGKVEVVKSPPPDTVSFIDLQGIAAQGAGGARCTQQRGRAALQRCGLAQRGDRAGRRRHAGRPGRSHQDDPRRQAHRHRHLAAEARLLQEAHFQGPGARAEGDGHPAGRQGRRRRRHQQGRHAGAGRQSRRGDGFHLHHQPARQ